MEVYWITDRTNGEATLVDGDTIERLLGVELGYLEWCIEVNGMFENGKWRVASFRCAPTNGLEFGRSVSAIDLIVPRLILPMRQAWEIFR